MWLGLVSRFNWDEAKYPVMSPLRETVESIHETVAKLEDDLKVLYEQGPSLKR